LHLLLMLSLAHASLGFSAPALSAPALSRSAVKMETAKDLEDLSNKLNPLVGYWDPMRLADYDQFSVGQEGSIGFLRHAEIKHGRVAMAAFVGFIAQSNGIVFPWAQSLYGTTFAQIASAGGPAAQWDALPTAAKVQILCVIGFLEICSESTAILEASGGKHYMKGGRPGEYPSLKKAGFPHPVPFDLWDPFGIAKNASPEKKAKGLLAEINNGRLAMIGTMAFMAESKVPGSVPALAGKIASYDGEIMAPFSAGDTSLPFVADMLKANLF